MCPVSKACSSYEALEIEIQAIKDELDALLQRAKEGFEVSATDDALGLRPDMSPEEIWLILSKFTEEDLFTKSYNSMEEGIACRFHTEMLSYIPLYICDYDHTSVNVNRQ